MSNNEELREKINKLKDSVQSVSHKWDMSKSYEDNIKAISELSQKEQRPVKTDFQDGYVIPAKSNLVDTEFSIIEQQGIKKESKDELFKLFDNVCGYQECNLVDEYSVSNAIICREIFERFPEERDKIDLPQTLMMYNVLKQSERPENKALLPEIEKDLQAKAWRFFAGERNNDDEFNKMVRPTPYSVSCISELREYMTNEMHAPRDVIEPKFNAIEMAMLSKVENLEYLDPEAEKVVLKAAMRNPEHPKSSSIFNEYSKYELNISTGKEL
ncbi:MAG: hypothetical protein IJZ30_00740 [Alphaproteobacteria bacterium]|nr:hypothetical protein [Alphaproteobacteria bacterium]